MSCRKQRSPAMAQKMHRFHKTMREPYLEDRLMDAEGAWPFALSGIPPKSAAPQFLMNESEVSADGVGPGFECSPDLQGKLIVVTLGITRIAEQQGVIVSIC